jgi:cardiolipin synthase A/B
MSPDAKMNWLNSGTEAFAAMLAAVEAARVSICFETYIYANDHVGEKFRAALIAAQARGVAVQVLIDGLGSFSLPKDYWQPNPCGNAKRSRRMANCS